MEFLTLLFSKLSELNSSEGESHYLAFFDDGSGFVATDQEDQFVLDFQNVEDAAIQIQSYIDL